MAERKHNRGTGASLYSAGGALAVLVILVLANLILLKVNIRWDATGDDLYSLSEGSRNIISTIETPVAIKVFYTKDAVNMPVHIKTYARRLIDFLDEYEHRSGSRISVEVYNPAPDSEEEEWAQKYGVEGFDLPTGDKVYFGLAAMAGTREESIPFLDPTREQHLEYDITRMVTRLQRASKPKVALFSGYPVFGQGGMSMGMQRSSQPWLFVSELQKTYEVVRIDAAEKLIDPAAELLILVHPTGMSDTLQYAVDQFLMGGGNLMVFADPLAMMSQQPGGGEIYPKKLFDAWGVQMASDRVTADFDNPTALRGNTGQVESNPCWLSLKEAGLNRDHIITGRLESVLLPIAGALTWEEKEGISYETLIRSSDNAALVESFKARFDVAGLRKGFTPGEKPQSLALMLRGSFASAFEERPPAEASEGAAAGETTMAEQPAHMASGKAASIVITADADMLYDAYYVDRQNFLGFDISRIFNDNLNYFLNACEMLSGDERLISIRSRGRFEKPFTRVLALEKKAQARWMDREQELLRKAEETNRKLQALEQQKDKSQKLILSDEQEAAIRQFKQDRIETNRQLKDVRRKLRSEIESLGMRIKFVNIFLVPLLVSMAGVFYAVARRRKRRAENAR